MRRRPLVALATLSLSLLSLSVVSGPLRAQQLGPDARAAGLAGAYGARARGAAAGFINPANLGLPSTPGFSVLLPTARVGYGAGPITLSDLRPYGGTLVPAPVKAEWLGRLAGSTPERLGLDADVGLGLSIGRVALTVGTVGRADASLPRDAVALLLYGNAGETGAPTDYAFTDGRFRGWAASVVGLSYGQPLPVHLTHAANERFAIGVTPKLVLGHGLVDAQDGSVRVASDPVVAEARFPVIEVRRDGQPIAARGWGLDAGLAYTSGRWQLGLAAQDLVNTMRFDVADARVREAHAFASIDSASADDGTAVALTAPGVDPALRARAEQLVADARFRPVVRASLAYQAARWAVVSADVVVPTRSGADLASVRSTSVSAGLELRPLGFLPLRGGVRQQGGTTSWTAGAGLELGGVGLEAAVGRGQSTAGAPTSVLAIGMVLGGVR